MELEKLQLNLRPRSNRQALDLGYELLHLDLWNVYWAWLALWLPLGLSVTILVAIFPAQAWWLWLLAWWPLPMLERAPLYVLARLVFGEEVSWRQALRAWPKQLSGGMWGLMTFGRLNTARGLYHAIWQLEGARGGVARERKQVLARSETSSSAFWYGVICLIFCILLAVGVIGLISIFMAGSGENVNPLALIFDDKPLSEQWIAVMATYLAWVIAQGIITPIFVSCSFTLYLNRRATLEAWDLELALRQIKPPRKVLGGKKESGSGASGKALGISLFGLALLWGSFQPLPVQAAKEPESAHLEKCIAPYFVQQRKLQELPPNGANQAKLHKEVEEIFSAPDLRPYKCVERWNGLKGKDQPYERQSDKSSLGSKVDATAGAAVKILLIAALALAIMWLVYRFRHQFAGVFGRESAEVAATEISGLDIRPESLPPNVTEKVKQLWQAGDKRAALALLYRATLSRLVQQDNLYLSRGATEGDCLQQATRAHGKEQLTLARLQLTRICTELWRDAAYGARWPETETVLQHCATWQAEFGNTSLEGLA